MFKVLNISNNTWWSDKLFIKEYAIKIVKTLNESCIDSDDFFVIVEIKKGTK